jgi:hypothetical protein
LNRVEQQLSRLCNHQLSSQEAGDVFSEGMEALQQNMAEILDGCIGTSRPTWNVANYMVQMAMTMGKIGTLENFLLERYLLYLIW